MAGGGATCGQRGGPGARYLRSGGGCCFREPPLAGQETGRALALAPPTGILGHSGWAGAEKCLSDHVLKPSTSGVGNAAAAWCWIARGKGRKAQHFSRPEAKAGAYNGHPQSSGVSGRRHVCGPHGLPSAVWVSPLLTPSPASYFSCNWDISVFQANLYTVIPDQPQMTLRQNRNVLHEEVDRVTALERIPLCSPAAGAQAAGRLEPWDTLSSHGH
ncbi:uncharacterized protein LOC123930519 [Meles meles]|uniref:uncharacterized protein LOC123930519 n=1 Tax=Meles meles TaxID=9662 RepID=UPI001E69F0C1|nr:uncharacterized protein LOC123930519 [Meles meles]